MHRDFREFRDLGGDFPRRPYHPGGGPGGGGGGRGGRRGGRRRRGDVRTALLALLADEPGHGYDLIMRLDERSGGTWRPSPGSIYPTLQLLEDEGLARSVERDGKRVYELTDAGREEAARRVDDSGGPPWERARRGGAAVGELREAVARLGLAARQVSMGGRPDQIERATAIVADARKQLYQLLAED
ncbi:MAG TPA: PadR family transcriptional regulator [Acidimicrobiales bacterium]